MPVSMLVLTCNDVDSAIKTLEAAKASVREQVVIDSSNEKEKRKLKKYARGNLKVKVYNILSLGIPEVSIPFGVSKCSEEFIFLADADEFASPYLLNTIKAMNWRNPTVRPVAFAFFIKRYENEEHSFSTWQLRLWLKGRVLHRGYSHEHAKIFSSSMKMSAEAYTTHMRSGTIREYPKQQHMRAYGPDPLLKLIMKDIFVILKTNPAVLIPCLKENIKLLKTSEEEKAIAKITSKIGIVKYLGLDQPGKLEELTRKYKNKKQGVDLLLKLLKEQHEKDNNESNNPHK